MKSVRERTAQGTNQNAHFQHGPKSQIHIHVQRWELSTTVTLRGGGGGGNLNYQIVAQEGFSLLYFESQSSHI